MNSDTELVNQAKRGDAHAFARLYEGIYQDLYRFALYTLRHAQDAEDAVGETVLDAFARIRLLRDAGAFRAWMFRILTTKCARRIRQYAQAPDELEESLRGTEADLDRQFDVRRALSLLPPEDRLIISMNIFAGYSSREIGEYLKMNPATVRSRLSRALKKLGRMLE